MPKRKINLLHRRILKKCFNIHVSKTHGDIFSSLLITFENGSNYIYLSLGSFDTKLKVHQIANKERQNLELTEDEVIELIQKESR